ADGQSGDGAPHRNRDGRTRNRAVVSWCYEIITSGERESRIERPADVRGISHDRVEHRLEVARRAADDAQDLAGGSLLLLGLDQLLVACLELTSRLRLALYRFSLTLQRRRQALLQVADLGAVVRRRLAVARSRAFRLSLLGLCPAIHPLLLTSPGGR